MASSELAFSSAESLSAAPAAEPALVERCRQGDPQAFARLVAIHEGMVLNLAARLLGDREEAKDIAQDVFLQVYRTLPRFEGRSTVRTWIYRIVVNQCCNRQRWWRRRTAPDPTGIVRLGGGPIPAPEATCSWSAGYRDQAWAGRLLSGVPEGPLGGAAAIAAASSAAVFSFSQYRIRSRRRRPT